MTCKGWIALSLIILQLIAFGYWVKKNDTK
jgi:hypothetical protein